jgi:hypothetical protein
VPHGPALFEFRRDVLGVLFVALKDFQPGFEQILQFGILRRRNKGAGQRRIHRFVIGHLVGDIGLVESGAAKLVELRALVRGLLAQRLAGVVVFRRNF